MPQHERNSVMRSCADDGDLYRGEGLGWLVKPGRSTKAPRGVQ